MASCRSAARKRTSRSSRAAGRRPARSSPTSTGACSRRPTRTRAPRPHVSPRVHGPRRVAGAVQGTSGEPLDRRRARLRQAACRAALRPPAVARPGPADRGLDPGLRAGRGRLERRPRPAGRPERRPDTRAQGALEGRSLYAARRASRTSREALLALPVGGPAAAVLPRSPGEPDVLPEPAPVHPRPRSPSTA